MRCSRVGGVILYSFDNGHFMAYTSPPPTAEPLLKEKPFGECTFQLSPIAVQRFRSYSTRPRGTPILIGAAQAKPGHGENEKSPRQSLLRTGRFNFHCCRGRTTGGQKHPRFNTSCFYAKTGSLLLSSLKKATFPSSSSLTSARRSRRQWFFRRLRGRTCPPRPCFFRRGSGSPRRQCSRPGRPCPR